MVSRDGFWRIIEKDGYTEKFITIVRQFYDGMQAKVKVNGESSVAFPVTNEVKQECVLPTSFQYHVFYDAI